MSLGGELERGDGQYCELGRGEGWEKRELGEERGITVSWHGERGSTVRGEGQYCELGRGEGQGRGAIL